QLPPPVDAQEARQRSGKTTYQLVRKKMVDYKMTEGESVVEIRFPKTVEAIRHALKRLPTLQREFRKHPDPHWTVPLPLSAQARGVLRHLLGEYPFELSAGLRQLIEHGDA